MKNAYDNYLVGEAPQGNGLETRKQEDKVNHPSHYNSGKIEVLDFIKDQLTEEEFRGYIKGNVLKYVPRERHKNGDEDLEKAVFYLRFLLGDDPRGK